MSYKEFIDSLGTVVNFFLINLFRWADALMSNYIFVTVLGISIFVGLGYFFINMVNNVLSSYHIATDFLDYHERKENDELDLHNRQVLQAQQEEEKRQKELEKYIEQQLNKERRYLLHYSSGRRNLTPNATRMLLGLPPYTPENSFYFERLHYALTGYKYGNYLDYLAYDHNEVPFSPDSAKKDVFSSYDSPNVESMNMGPYNVLNDNQNNLPYWFDQHIVKSATEEDKKEMSDILNTF